MTQQQSDVFAVVYVETHHVAGDERSRANPGHGYPAHTLSYNVFLEFDSEDKFKDWVKRALNPTYGQPRKFRAFRCTPLNISTEIKINIGYFPPLEIHHFVKAQADEAFIIPPTHNKDCGCPLHLHVSKPRSRTMLNALKIEAKRHNKRKGSEVYHKRVQKKWDKRVLKEGSACKLSVQVPVQVSMAQNFSNLLISLES